MTGSAAEEAEQCLPELAVLAQLDLLSVPGSCGNAGGESEQVLNSALLG